jgi:hypothetical protein
MKKMINKTHVEGYVYENELKLNVAGAQAKNPGMEYITGKLHIETAENNIVAVDFYESALTSKQAPNNKFATLKPLVGGPSVMSAGRDSALMVKVDSAVSLNDWFKGEELVSTPRNFGGFLHAVPKVTPSATFETDMLIVNTQPEMVKGEDGEMAESGRLVVNGFIFDFANKIMPVKYIVENPNGVKFFESMDVNTFTKVWGNQVSSTFKTTKIEESAFGDSKVIESEYTRKEWIVTGAMKEPYMNETDLTAADVQTALAARNIYLAELKKKAEERAAQKNAAPAGGFAAPGGAASGSPLAGLNMGGGFNF